MDAIGDLLPKDFSQEPDEFRAIREYIQKNFDANSSVATQQNSYIITVPDGVVAMQLRTSHDDLQASCKLPQDKKIHIRINPNV